MIDFPASPTTGQIFTAAGASWRYDGTKWVAYGSGSGNVGRNLIHNPLYAVQQRGTGAWTSGYTADRWTMYYVNGSQSISIVALSDANRAAIGDEAATSAIQAVVTGSATAGSINQFYQNMESVRRLAGKTVTISFWAWAASGTPKLGVSIQQSFGSGGGASGAVVVPGQAVTISTTPTRYTATFAVPSVAGKTLGTDQHDVTSLVFFYSGATDQNTTTGTVGVQSGTFTIWGVQLEIGSAATPLEKPDPADDLARCQRFYEITSANIFNLGYAAASGSVCIWMPFAVEKRASPTIEYFFTSYYNGSAVSASGTNTRGVGVQWTVTALGLTWCSTTVLASADL